MRGGAEVLKAIENELGIVGGGTTDDLEFTLETVACIGACGLAPVIMINDDTHGRQSYQCKGYSGLLQTKAAREC